MYAVNYFYELSFNIPIQFFCLLTFKVLKLFNKVEFKFNRNPRGKLQGYIDMGKRTTILAGFGL